MMQLPLLCHFDGRGNVVAYLGLDIDLGEFSGKNDKQILENCKKLLERNFYRQKQQLRGKDGSSIRINEEGRYTAIVGREKLR